MHRESSGSRGAGDSRLERAIVLELLSGDRQGGSTQAELGVALEVDADALDVALRGLHEVGVLDLDGERATASAAARRLDELELLAI